MPESIIKYLGDQPTMKVIRALMLSSKPRHIRDLASQYSLSPAGVSDIIRRLNELGALKENRVRNQRKISLSLLPEERACLRSFFLTYENYWLEERAKRFNKNAVQKLKWMDDAYKFYRKVKGKRHDPS